VRRGSFSGRGWRRSTLRGAWPRDLGGCTKTRTGRIPSPPAAGATIATRAPSASEGAAQRPRGIPSQVLPWRAPGPPPGPPGRRGRLPARRPGRPAVPPPRPGASRPSRSTSSRAGRIRSRTGRRPSAGGRPGGPGRRAPLQGGGDGPDVGPLPPADGDPRPARPSAAGSKASSSSECTTTRRRQPRSTSFPARADSWRPPAPRRGTGRVHGRDLVGSRDEGGERRPRRARAVSPRRGRPGRSPFPRRPRYRCDAGRRRAPRRPCRPP